MELFDNGAERAILAGLYQYGAEAFVEISDILEESSFGSVQNAVVYRCLKFIINQGMSVDLPSLLSAAEQLKLTDAITTDQNIQYLKSLSSLKVNKDNIFNFALQVKKYEFARNIKDVAGKISQDVDKITGTETIDEIIALMEDPLTEFLKQDTQDERPQRIGEDIFAYLDYLEENQCDMMGIPTGFTRFDQAIGGGLRRKCVDLIAARPKTGKSVCADAVAVNVTRLGIPVLMIDTEMSKEDHAHRVLASMSGVKINEIATGRFSNDADKKQLVLEAAKEYKTLPYDYISVAGKPFTSILNYIKRWVTHTVGKDENGNTKDCVIIFDYLKLMSSEGVNASMQEYQLLGFQITALHNLCVKLDVPCLAFVQLNRDGITKESTDAVSGSDRLIWLCTSFTIFKQKSEEEIAEDGVRAGNRKFVPIVARHGGGLDGGDYINLQMTGDISKLEELKTRNEFKMMPEQDTGLISKENLDNYDEEAPFETEEDVKPKRSKKQTK